MENKEILEEYLSLDLRPGETPDTCFDRFLTGYGNGGRLAVHVPEKHPLLYSREYENARRKIIESGHLYAVHVYTDTSDCLTLEFDFENTYDKVEVSPCSFIPVDEFAKKHYVLERVCYKHISCEGTPFGSTSVPLTELATVFDELSEEDEKLVMAKLPDVYDEITYDMDGSNGWIDSPAVLPVISTHMSKILLSEDTIVMEPVAECRRPMMGPCVLVFGNINRFWPDEQNERFALVRENGPFCLSREIKEEPVLCLRPKEGVSLEYLALSVMNDMTLFNKLASRSYLEYEEEIIDLPYDREVKHQQKLILDIKRSGLAANTDVNILIVGGDVSHIKETLVSEPGLNCLETCDYKSFSSKTITRYNRTGKTSVDAVIFKVDSVENLLSVIRERQNTASIPFYYFLNIDEQQIQPYRPLLNSPEDIFINGADDKDSILLLGSTIKHDVVKTPSDGFLLRAEHATEFSAAELTSGETAHLLTDLLAQKDLPDDMLRSSFNDIRRILDSIFSQPPFNKKLKLGAFATLLKEGCFVDEGCHCYYIDHVRKVMSEPLADALCYLVDQVNEESHGTDMLGYTIATGSMNLYRSALYILLDILKWFNFISKYDIKLRYENLYQYKNVVEKNDDGIHFCGRIKLDPQKARGLAGKKVEIRSASANKYFAKDGFPLYSNDFKEIQSL